MAMLNYRSVQDPLAPNPRRSSGFAYMLVHGQVVSMNDWDLEQSGHTIVGGQMRMKLYRITRLMPLIFRCFLQSFETNFLVFQFFGVIKQDLLRSFQIEGS
jgi:hypothetical protein